MLSDFDLISHSFDTEIKIAPIADVHLGAIECAEDRWAEFQRRVLAQNLYIILAGDLLDNGTKNTSFVNPFDQKYRPREAKKLMVEYLEGIKDRLLVAVSGNHERRTRDVNQDLTYDILTKLDKEDIYRENVAFMRVGVGRRNGGKYGKRENSSANTYVFAVTHGTGGGIYTGASVNRDERWGNVIEGIDCVVTGHVHKGFISKPSKIVVDAHNGRVSMKHYVVVSCVSWLNYGGYAAQKMLLPSHVADSQILTLSAIHDNKRIITEW